jgi:4-hydroxybenzoate polyprenyltransferase
LENRDGKVVGDYLRLARPRHWVKNVIVLLPVVFAQRILELPAWWRAGLAAGAFCLASSATYAFNDIMDRREDRLHPEKQNRPVAAGRLAPGLAALESILLVLGAVGLGLAVGRGVGVIVLGYLALQLAYSHLLKHRMLLDVICIAVGFVLRAGAGAVAIGVEASPWLVVCTFTLCLFMGFCKRRTELSALSDSPSKHRRTLLAYGPRLLGALIVATGALAVLSYLLYTISPRTVGQFGTHALLCTLPIVVYGIWRFAVLSLRAAYDGPTDLILHDRPFQAAALLWLGLTVAIIRWSELLRW